MHRKEIRFLFVGILNTIFGYGLYALFCFWKIDPTIAITFSTVLGTIHSYFWNKYYTFKVMKKSLKELIRFISVYTVAYVINLGVVYYFSRLTSVDKYLVGMVSIFVSTIISYVGHNWFSFKEI